MGACASRPKDIDDVHPEPLPSDVPASESIETNEPVAQEENKGGEELKEAPLVDLSESKPEGEIEITSSKPKTEAAEPVPVAADVGTVVAKPAAEEKVEAAAATVVEEQKAEVVAAPVVFKEKSNETEAKQTEVVAPENVENKKDAPLVSA